MPEQIHPITQPKASPTYTVWIRNPNLDDPVKVTGVVEAVRFPDRIDLHRADGIHDQSYGEIVRVRQEIEGNSPAVGGFELLLLPEGRYRDVADALALPSGSIRLATSSGEQHAAEGSILWLRRECDYGSSK